jgi:sRNA-binding protein
MEIERQKREQAARRAAAELQAKLDAEAAEATRKAQEEAKKAGLKPETVEKIVAPQVPEPIMPEEKQVTRTDSGSSYGRKEWTAEVENVDLIPVLYLAQACRTKKGTEALTSVLKDAVKMGIREVPGVKIWEKPTTVFKTN